MITPRIVKDSSRWSSTKYLIPNLPRGAIHFGVVRQEFFNKNYGGMLYEVELIINGRQLLMICYPSYAFSSPVNYEEFSRLAVKQEEPEENLAVQFGSRVGDVVIVGEIDNGNNEGVILGSLRHPAVSTSLVENELSYVREFNGVKTTIDKDGAWKLMFQGVPKNLDKIIAKHVNNNIPKPEYDEKLAGSYITFDKEGSFEISDGAEKPQTIKLDKTNKKLTVTSGEISIEIAQDDKKITMKCDETSISSKKWKLEGDEMDVKAQKSVKIDSMKVAIGHGDTELIDWILKLVDALGKLTLLHPYGPTSPMQASPQWAEILTLKTKLSMIKGSL